MEKVDLVVIDLYTLKALIYGFSDPEKGIFCPGFVNEKTSESAKRSINRVGKAVLTELEAINKQRLEVASYTEEGKSEEELAQIRSEKDVEILNDKLTLTVDKADFSKVADDKFTFNYQILYDKFFKD